MRCERTGYRKSIRVRRAKRAAYLRVVQRVAPRCNALQRSTHLRYALATLGKHQVQGQAQAACDQSHSATNPILRDQS